MGQIVDTFEYCSQGLEDTGKLVIFCTDSNSNDSFPLNEPLAIMLDGKTMIQRSLNMEKYVSDIITVCEKEVVKGIDILFNPEYKIDALKILENINKSKHFCVEWPGKLEDGKLIYAEPGYKDFKTYDISNYDIICVK